MAGTINSLGLGSGMLTSDVIDKLKSNDKSIMITPLENKIALQRQKGDALKLLGSLLYTFKSNVNALSDDTLYQARSVSGNTSSVNVTSNSGVNIQSFSISNVKMALNDIQESGKFTSTGSSVASGNGTMTLSAGGAIFNINYTNTMTLDQLKDAINTETSGRIKASTLQVGTNDYRLILRSSDTGADQAITISDSTGMLNNTLTSYKKIESQAFAAPTDLVASSLVGTGLSGNFDLQIGTVTKNITYDETTTLQDLRDAINTAVGGNPVASIDATGRLLIQSNVAGFSTNLSLTDKSGQLDSKLTGYTTLNPIENIQSARDASFNYNGVTLTRSSNEITDLIPGATINLLEDSTSTANISINQDTSAISGSMSSLVESYNTLTSQLKNMTIANVEEGKIGIFSGDNSINSLTREITRIITSMDSKGMSLAHYGIDLKEDGSMSFNATTFNTKFKSDTVLSETFFSNIAEDGKGEDGVFTKLSAMMKRYTGSKGIVDTLTAASANELKTLDANKKRAQDLLNARYDTMAARFAQYDSIISRINSQFSSLQQQIQMAINAKN